MMIKHRVSQISKTVNLKWTIFCQVIDNYGDIGICWRLAKSLVNYHNQQVSLYVDDLVSFRRLCSAVNPDLSQQEIAHIKINKWADNLAINLGDVIIEAFGCNLGQSVIQKMNEHHLWINLEYLTCEDWVQNWHGLPSLQPNNLRKYVFFPSLQLSSGGILYEPDLASRLKLFYGFDGFNYHHQNYQNNRNQFLANFGIYPESNSQIISLFCYQHAYLDDWLEYLSQQQQITHLLVLGDNSQHLAITKIINSHQNAFKNQQRSNISIIIQQNLHIHLLPFVNQEDFDYLLASCDFNIVRGEDSFLRAQLVGKPFLWHIYPQQNEAHLIKLQAFTDIYLHHFSDSAGDKNLANHQIPEKNPTQSILRQQIAQLFRAFNYHQNNQKDQNHKENENWLVLWQQIAWNDWQIQAQNWANYQLSRDDLATNLVNFARSKLIL